MTLKINKIHTLVCTLLVAVCTHVILTVLYVIGIYNDLNTIKENTDNNILILQKLQIIENNNVIRYTEIIERLEGITDDIETYSIESKYYNIESKDYNIENKMNSRIDKIEKNFNKLIDILSYDFTTK
jgi:hypothetical protein